MNTKDEALRQALEACEAIVRYQEMIDNDEEVKSFATYAKAVESAEDAIPAIREALVHVASTKPYAPLMAETIAGAIFDFLGFLTSRDARLALSRSDECSPAIFALEEWAALRGLCLNEANVKNWQEALAQPEQEPVKFLADGTRFKVANVDSTCGIFGLPTELTGRWVALVAADNDSHLQYAAPQPAQKPLTVERATAVYKASFPGYLVRSIPDESLNFIRNLEAAHNIKDGGAP